MILGRLISVNSSWTEYWVLTGEGAILGYSAAESVRAVVNRELLFASDDCSGDPFTALSIYGSTVLNNGQFYKQVEPHVPAMEVHSARNASTGVCGAPPISVVNAAALELLDPQPTNPAMPYRLTEGT